MNTIVPDALPHEKRALFVVELRNLANSLNESLRAQFTQHVLEIDELLELNRMDEDIFKKLADSLLDGTVFDILQELRDIQKMTENDLALSRAGLIAEQQQIRDQILSKNAPVMSSTTFYGHSAASYSAAVANMQQSGGSQNPEILRFNEKCEEELKKRDMRIVLELDGLVSQQQLTLEKAGIPGFFVTNKAEEIRMQMFIVDFIDKLKNKM